MTDIQNGDMFDIAGYDVVARAQCDLGDVLVLTNNSTHYLVAETADDGDLVRARLVDAFEYGAGSCHAAYRQALELMARTALYWSDSLDEPADDAELPQAARKMWS